MHASFVIALVTLVAVSCFSTTHGADVTITATEITSDTTWRAINTYYLNSQLFIKNNAKLTIQAGTTIKAAYDDGAGKAPSIIVTQGAKIDAM